MQRYSVANHLVGVRGTVGVPTVDANMDADSVGGLYRASGFDF
jgi:hypothetical protein